MIRTVGHDCMRFDHIVKAEGIDGCAEIFDSNSFHDSTTLRIIARVSVQDTTKIHTFPLCTSGFSLSVGYFFFLLGFLAVGTLNGVNGPMKSTPTVQNAFRFISSPTV